MKEKNTAEKKKEPKAREIAERDTGIYEDMNGGYEVA